MKEFLQSPVTWSGLINVIAIWFILKTLASAIGLLVDFVHRAVRRRLVRKAVERFIGGPPQSGEELKQFLESLGLPGVFEVREFIKKDRADKGHAAPPPPTNTNPTGPGVN